MIIQVSHISSVNQNEFVNMITEAVEKMQNEKKLKVEIQYQASTITDETTYIVYSAILIGRDTK